MVKSFLQQETENRNEDNEIDSRGQLKVAPCFNLT